MALPSRVTHMMKMLFAIRIAALFAISFVSAQGSPVGQASHANGSVRDLLTGRDWVINSGRGDAILKFRADGTIEVKGKNRPPTRMDMENQE